MIVPHQAPFQVLSVDHPIWCSHNNPMKQVLDILFGPDSQTRSLRLREVKRLA